MTATEPTITEEEALWQAIGAAPEDALPRLVAADWFDERVGTVRCEKCNGRAYIVGLRPSGYPDFGWWDCSHCSGTGYVSNGFAETAAALRATKEFVPSAWAAGRDGDGREYVFERSMIDQPEPQFFSHLGSGPFAAQETADLSIVDCDVFDAMEGESGCMYFMLGKHGHRRYPTAADAVRDLCRAYVKVHGEGV